ncbi:MAG: DUF6250 domain-containing protein [Pseudomonas sp.]
MSAGRVLLADDFGWRRPWRWIAEVEQPATSRLYLRGGRLWLDSSAGMTVWLGRRLSGRYRIEYEREVFDATAGGNARLSDLNQFWAARDPRRARLFTRHGALAEYDMLDLYYVGLGSNGNTTTRLRRYDGHGQRLLLGEYTDPAHLLQAGRRYRVRIDVDGEGTAFWIDGERWFVQRGAVADGYFGFRTTWSLQAIDAFRITAL